MKRILSHIDSMLRLLLFNIMLLCIFYPIDLSSQNIQVIRPKEIDSVLTNPGIGFMTFQRFNGDKLNPLNENGVGWTEGYPIKYQEFNGNLKNKDYPQTSIAYFRVYWRFIEPQKDKYRWNLIDKALLTAAQRGQTLMLRIAPYGHRDNEDIPDWLRNMIGPNKKKLPEKWRVDAEDKRYIEHFTDLIRDLGKRYDGHPFLESVDMALVGFWGEGEHSELLSEKTRRALIDAYLEAFPNTQLIMLLTDPKTNGYGLSKRNVGWRVDCLGDLGEWATPTNNYWCHMYDAYPEDIIRCGMKDAWEKAPVTMETCGVLYDWLKNGYDIDYIIDQSLKWHISSLNAKSSPVPRQWRDKVDNWLKRMGYRFVLRRFSCPKKVSPNSKFEFSSWWENKGVAPCYRNYPLAIRLKNNKRTEIFILNTDIREWLPGDALYEDGVFIPYDMPTGEYELDIAIVNNNTHMPVIKLANEGRLKDGWYRLTKVVVQK